MEKAIKLLLRSSDELLRVLETYSIPINDLENRSVSNNADSSESINESRRRRIVAVVTHKDEENDWEEGSVFILKNKLFSSPYQDEFEIDRVLPVHGDFTITMAQVNRADLGVSVQLPSESALNQSRSGLRLHITPGGESEPLDLFTYDVQGLKNVLAECRRLRELAGMLTYIHTDNISLMACVDLSPETQTYSWLAPYVSNNVHIPPFTSVFPNIQETHRPLFTRLSPASAGTPGEDGKDVITIRDDWIRSRARNECRKARARLHLRIGTFNVNGKMPSQDLSVWVRSTVNEKKDFASVLPPLNEISPFSIGENNPIDEQVEDTLQTTSSSFSYSSTASTNAVHSPSPTASSFSTAPSVFTATPSATTVQTENSVLPSPASSTSVYSPIIVETEPVLVPTLNADQTDPSDPDMLILGFQELDLSAEALIYSTSTVREDAWCTAIFAALGEKGGMYEKLASKQLVGMLIIIIVKKSLKSCFSNIMTSSAGVGLMGYMGNKGGTAIRLTFTPPTTLIPALDNILSHESTKSGEPSTPTATSPKLDFQPSPSSQPSHESHGIKNLGSTVLTFVCSHLAAFDEMVAQRNTDYHSLIKKFVFDSSSAVSGVVDAESQEMPGQFESSPQHHPQEIQEKFSVFETDTLFWMGDLNYRIDLPDQEVRTLLSSEHWSDHGKYLLKYDQLKNSIENKHAFDMFSEHEITHLPTYRFSPGVAVDSLGYDVKRKPAWTDRILYVHSPLTTQIQPVTYASHREISFSDHQPVSAEFALDVDLFDKHQIHATATSLFRQVYGMEEQQERSKLRLSENTVDFGDLFYGREKTYTLSIQNTGKVPVAFRFLPLDAESEIHPRWLKISRMTGLLLPKELIEITMTTIVDNDVASELNLGPRNLNHTLILHSVMGKDLFVVVSATYHYTCFANELSRLTRLPGSIRALRGPEDLLHEDRAINAPREVMRLVNWMMTTSHSVDCLFLNRADQDIVHRLRECLDTGEDFPYSHEAKDSTVLVAFGETLLQLLDSLTECIVSTSLHAQCVSPVSRDEAFEVLDSFPQATVNVWISVTAFLHYVVQTSPDPESKAQRIATVFAPVFFGLFRKDSNPSASSATSTPAITPLQSQAFILHFIQ
ncbi:DNase I-like protein [Dendrothele bispora CBS 962.96]|uniref:DNase I-like protein n=1 Tax=Dendrothele bispora (strain CBS 962.96) TaxID=1314807 RepID=A0A4S8MJ54_DENBC|nr:DNase I-like protein [Dendrothele bispora CBS 962.96]